MYVTRSGAADGIIARAARLGVDRVRLADPDLGVLRGEGDGALRGHRVGEGVSVPGVSDGEDDPADDVAVLQLGGEGGHGALLAVSRPAMKPAVKAAPTTVPKKAEAIDGVAMEELSMGMSHDYRIAAREGATLVRVGTALYREP